MPKWKEQQRHGGSSLYLNDLVLHKHETSNLNRKIHFFDITTSQQAIVIHSVHQDYELTLHL